MADEIRPHLFAALPHVRAFAISLTGDVDRADDLVQEGIVRALGHLHQFQRGTNFRAWMFTIVRNQFYSTYRKRSLEVQDADGVYAEKLVVAPEQESLVEFTEMRKALAKLPAEQREAILLICAQGLSYEEAAAICGTKLGTMKSRVNRARKRLAELLGYNGAEEVGPAATVLAVLANRAQGGIDQTLGALGP